VRGLVYVGPPETARVIVTRGAHHARVTPPAGTAEEPVVGHAEFGAGGGEFPDAVLPQPGPVSVSQVRQRRRDDLTQFAERARDERDLRALGGRPGADRLVIGVRMHEQQLSPVLRRTHGREPTGPPELARWQP
jgi:hypothetical protein